MLEGFEIEGLLRFILSKILLFHFKVFFPDKVSCISFQSWHCFYLLLDSCLSMMENYPLIRLHLRAALRLSGFVRFDVPNLYHLESDVHAICSCLMQS